jgi:hypothetical protein
MVEKILVAISSLSPGIGNTLKLLEDAKVPKDNEYHPTIAKHPHKSSILITGN